MLAPPNAGAQARREAEAQRTLYAVACRPLIMIEASPSAYPSGMLAVGKEPFTKEEETSCDSTPNNTHFTVVSTCMPGEGCSVARLDPLPLARGFCLSPCLHN